MFRSYEVYFSHNFFVFINDFFFKGTRESKLSASSTLLIPGFAPFCYLSPVCTFSNC